MAKGPAGVADKQLQRVIAVRYGADSEEPAEVLAVRHGVEDVEDVTMLTSAQLAALERERTQDIADAIASRYREHGARR